MATNVSFRRLGTFQRLGLGLDLGTERLGLGLVSAEFSNVSVSSRVSRADVSGLVSVSDGKVSCTSLAAARESVLQAVVAATLMEKPYCVGFYL